MGVRWAWWWGWVGVVNILSKLQVPNSYGLWVKVNRRFFWKRIIRWLPDRHLIMMLFLGQPGYTGCLTYFVLRSFKLGSALTLQTWFSSSWKNLTHVISKKGWSLPHGRREKQTHTHQLCQGKGCCTNTVLIISFNN